MMRDAVVGPGGARIRWVELPGSGPVRLCLHGAGGQSAAYFTYAMSLPALAGRRTIMMDLLGYGLSDRPAEFSYRLEDQADAVARALDLARVADTEVVAHSMGGAVAISLAARRPDLVARLVVVEPPLDPVPPPAPGATGITSFTEADFADHGMAQYLGHVDPVWAATLRLADPVALHRSAFSLRTGTTPPARQLLTELPIPRLLIVGERSGAPADQAHLEAAGVRVVTIAGAGHNVTLDNPDAFAEELAHWLGR